MNEEEYLKQLNQLVAQREHVSKCAMEEEDREVRYDMYSRVDRINDAISELAKHKNDPNL